MRRKYSGFTLRDALQMLQVTAFTPWALDAPPLPPSDHLPELLGALDHVCGECSRNIPQK